MASPGLCIVGNSSHDSATGCSSSSSATSSSNTPADASATDGGSGRDLVQDIATTAPPTGAIVASAVPSEAAVSEDDGGWTAAPSGKKSKGRASVGAPVSARSSSAGADDASAAAATKPKEPPTVMRDAVKRMLFYQPPRILTVHLKVWACTACVSSCANVRFGRRLVNWTACLVASAVCANRSGPLCQDLDPREVSSCAGFNALRRTAVSQHWGTAKVGDWNDV